MRPLVVGCFRPRGWTMTYRCEQPGHASKCPSSPQMRGTGDLIHRSAHIHRTASRRRQPPGSFVILDWKYLSLVASDGGIGRLAEGEQPQIHTARV
jgi:hypothetical protein